MRWVTLCLAVCFFWGEFAPFTRAEEEPAPKFSSKHGTWSVYTYQSDGSPVCYTLSSPKKSDPPGLKRDPSYFLITRRPKDKTKHEISNAIGYPFKKDSTATLKIGQETFELFTSGGGAWSQAQDDQIINALKKNKTMTIAGESWRGKKTTDTYTLSGLKDALKRVEKLCPFGKK